MSPNVFCPFCGVILAQDPHSSISGPESIPRHRRPWYAEIRGIVSPNAPAENIILTGIGTLHSGGVLIAPADSERSYVDTEGLYPVSIFGRSPVGWGFHSACWQLLSLRLHPLSEKEISRSVFDVLYNTPCRDGSVFDFGHDYSGAVATHNAHGQVEIGHEPVLYMDPCAIPSLDELENSGSAEAVSHFGLGNYEPRVFGSLSTELKHEILAYLSYRDVCMLRLLCRELADITHPWNLPQSYWRSRFLLGQEADFLFPSLLEKRHWPRLYLGTRGLLNSKSPPFINRKRIRGLIEHFAALVELYVAQPPLHGSPVWPEPGSDDCFVLTDKEKSLLRAYSFFSGHSTARQAHETLQVGCRILHYRSGPILIADRSRQHIIVSTIQIGARCFISGVRFAKKDTASLIGYHHSASGATIYSPDQTNIRTIHVAFSSQGLTGISFTFSNSESSPWIGQSHGPEIALGNLSMVETEPCYLVAGLDSFKIVALGVAVINSKPPPPVPRVHPRLWLPAVPHNEGVDFSTLLPPQSTLPFAPLISIDFGAPQGQCLAELTRLVFCMGSGPNPMRGVKAVYANGMSRLFGSENGTELSFCIDGPHGERLTKIAILHRADESPHDEELQYGKRSNFCGLQMSTNRGRTATLSTMESRMDAKVAIHELKKTKPGHDITGFVAIQVPPQEAFLGFGIQSQRSLGPFQASAIMLKELNNPDAQLQRDNKFSIYIGTPSDSNYQTHATLVGVRKISASRGTHWGSRPCTCVSGLKFDYYNGTSAVVGQWLDEFESLELQPSEHVHSLDIWVTPTRLSTSYPFLQQGWIAAVRFGTTFARDVRFKPPGSDPLSMQHLHNHFGGGPGQELTAISWILNESHDRIRAVNSDKSFGHTSLLLPEQYPPFDDVQKLYFENVLTGCSPDLLVTAEACYKGTAILGLIFTYSSGARATIGDVVVVPDARQTMHFPPDTEFVGMSVRVRRRNVLVLQFELKTKRKSESNDHPTPNAPTEFKTLCFQRDDQPGTDKHCDDREIRDRRSTWCKNTLSAETFTRKRVSDDVYAPPDGTRLVGLYVRCQHFEHLGALYEPLN
ncbi:F-box protein [Aspergillus foveolatus]|uniref:F-box protein n=1 Tax=Aspergillus foveolatus TaxID=210207 RepID=UPI003CCCD5F5